jgi:PAS domain S-box-containing protein
MDCSPLSLKVLLTILSLNFSILPERVFAQGFCSSTLADIPSYNTYPAWIVYLLLSIIIVLAIFFVYFYITYRRKRNYDDYITKNLLKSMPEMAVITDKSLHIINLYNPQESIMQGEDARTFLGVNLDSIIKRTSQISPESKKKMLQSVQDTITDKQSRTITYEFTLNGVVYYSQAKIVSIEEGLIIFTRDISALMKSEKETLKLKTFLESILEKLPVGVFIKDVENKYRYLFYNELVSKFYNTTDSAVIGKNDFELNKPEAPSFQKEDEVVLQSNHPIASEREFKDENGNTIRWAVTTKSKLITSEGEKYIIATVEDTTERRKKAMEIAKIQQELKLSMDATSLSSWDYDVEKKEMTSLYNNVLDEDTTSLEALLSIIHPDDRQRYMQMVNELCLGNKKKDNGVYRYNYKGKTGWIETYAIALKSEETGKVTNLIGTAKEITEELLQQKQLEEQKKKIEFILNAAQISSWEYNVETETFYVSNPLITEQTEKTMEQYMKLVQPQYREETEKTFTDVISGKINFGELQIEVNSTYKGIHWFEIQFVPYERDKDNHVKSLTGLLWDITHLKMTTELIRLRDKAEESNRLKSAFLANMSHEIRTPLNAIVGFSNLIAQGENPEEINEYVRIIETNNELLLQLINDILDLSKIEAGQMDFNYTDVSLNEILQELHSVFEKRVYDHVALICEIPDEDCRMHTEKNRIMQVLGNFLSNACKYTTAGSITMGYKKDEDNQILFYVKDTGKGIAPENVSHVFERFAKFDKFVRGTGLGLSICESIVKTFHGQIGVESKLGEGSYFWFTLPFQPPTMN